MRGKGARERKPTWTHVCGVVLSGGCFDRWPRDAPVSHGRTWPRLNARSTCLYVLMERSSPTDWQDRQTDAPPPHPVIFHGLESYWYSLYQLFPPQSAASQNYNLRRRSHNRQLHEHQGHPSDCNFIRRLLQKNLYWLNNIYVNCKLYFFIVPTISFIYTCIVISSAVCQMS